MTAEMGLLEQLTVAELNELEIYEQQIAKGVEGFIAVGAALLEIRERRLYRSSHRNFADYLDARWPQIGTRRQADRLINAAVVEENLRPIGLSLASESQGRALAGLPPEQQREAFQAAATAAGDKPPTSAQVEQAARAARPAAPELTNAELLTLGTHPLCWHRDPGYDNAPLIAMRNGIRPGLPPMLKTASEWREIARNPEIAKQIAPPASQHDARPLLIAKFEAEAELIARAVALGYTVTPYGSGYRIARGSSPYGGARDLDELTHLVEGWELDNRIAAASAIDAPIIVAPIAEAEAEAITPAAPASARNVLVQHAETVWSGLIERSSPEERRLLHCLLLAEPSAPDEDVADELWQIGRAQLGEMFEPDLEWIKSGMPESIGRSA